MIKEFEKYFKLNNTVIRILNFLKIIGIASAILMFQYEILIAVFFTVFPSFIVLYVYHKGLETKIRSIKWRIDMDNLWQKTMDDFYNRQKQYDSYRQRLNNLYKESNIQNAFTLLKLKMSDDKSTIKKRYRELSLKWHPDKWINDTIENQDIAKRNFQKLNNAYDIIKKYKNIK